MMPGVTFQEIRDAIVDAYDEADLKEVVRTQMNVRLDVEIGPGALGHRIFDLVSWAEMRGRDVELVQVTARARPRKAGMQAIYKKYGMAIPVFVQAAGAAVPATPADASDPGLERVIRPFLLFADFGIWRERMTRVESQVCRITLNDAARGTGFLVGPDTVLTNYHVMEPVLKNPSMASSVKCEFDFKKVNDGTKIQTPASLHPTDWQVDSSPYSKAEGENQPGREPATIDELDYALIRLAEPVGSKAAVANPNEDNPPGPRGWVRVPDVAPEFGAHMAIIIAQHPDGQPLKLAIDTQAIDKEAGLWLQPGGTRVRYATNTEGGSSGSPCFDFNWGLIALHHYGDTSYGQPKYNQGVPIGQIRDRLKRVNKADALGGDSP